MPEDRGQTIIRDLSCNLHENEVAERSQRLAGCLEQYRKVETEKPQLASSMGEELKRLRAESDGLATIVRTKTEIREVEVRQQIQVMTDDEAIYREIRLDTNVIILERKATQAEKQGSFL